MNPLFIPNIEVESAQGTREVSLPTRHLMNGDLFPNGEIDTEQANSFLSQLLYLEKHYDRPVTIYINSPGGRIDAGLMIYDVLQGSRLTIHMICTVVNYDVVEFCLYR